MDEYLDLAGNHIRRWVNGTKENLLFLKPGERPDLERLRREVGQSDNWSAKFSAAVHESDAEAWAMSAAGYQVTFRQDEIQGLLAYFPLTGLGETDAAGRLLQLFQRWCGLLHAEHGYAGLGWVLPTTIGAQSAAVELLGPHAQRFVGLDVDLPATTTIKCQEGIRRVAWLTAVSSRLLQRVGGAEEVARRAGARISAHAYDGGTIFQAGPHPQFGDTSQGLVPQAYVDIGRALRPIRARYGTLFYDPDFAGQFNVQANGAYSERWLGAFDGE
jgi:hypothetical protein